MFLLVKSLLGVLTESSNAIVLDVLYGVSSGGTLIKRDQENGRKKWCSYRANMHGGRNLYRFLTGDFLA